MIWDGTTYDKLFKRKNLLTMIIIATADIVVYVWTLIMSRDLFIEDESQKRNTYLEELHLLWLYSLSMFGNIFIYFIFI